MNLKQRLKTRQARIGVMGLGHVGLPLAMEFCRKGFRVDGFDVSRERIRGLKRGRSHVLDVPGENVARFVREGLLGVYDRFERLGRCDAILICVQTPLRKTKEPDIGNIMTAVTAISRHLRRCPLIVLESTTFPGTTQEIVLPALEQGGRRLGRDFHLAFSPERVDPGNSRYGIANTPKVVGGADSASTDLACELYSLIVRQVVPVSSPSAAETVKLLENSFRAVNIALINEMAQICHRLGLDVWEIVEAAATKPFGFMPFYPGPGIGGHCIPKDPQLLAWKMKTLNFDPRFINLASAVNGSMPGYAVERIASVLNERRKSLSASRILVLGVAYKPGTSDFRESPALDVIELLRRAKADVAYHDPYVSRVYAGGRPLRSCALNRKNVSRADCVAILTAHSDIDYAEIVRWARVVFDARNATRGLRSANIRRL